MHLIQLAVTQHSAYPWEIAVAIVTLVTILVLLITAFFLITRH